MSARVTRKRARKESVGEAESSAPNLTPAIEDPHAIPQESRTRDAEFWYDDGTVTLIAKNTEFRVYKGILAEHSPVFRDMFSLPQPPAALSSNAAPSGDRCPVVHLSDSPEDIRHVLRVYMPKCHQSLFFPEHPSRPSFDANSATVRLAHKYQMSTLLEHAVGYLTRYYTTDFDTWESYDTYNPLGFRDEHSISVVNLAYLTGETTILPAALLACCQLDKELIAGFEREDGTREQLAPDDIGRCIAAKPKLIHEATRIALFILRPTMSDRCEAPGDCESGFKMLMKELEAHVDDAVGNDPYRFNAKFGYELFTDVGLCPPCQAMLEDRGSRQRRAVWYRLPKIMGIESPRTWPGSAAEDRA